MSSDYSNFSRIFEKELVETYEHLCRVPGGLWGFAIMLGEDIDLLSCIAVTLSNEQIANPNRINSKDFLYLPDEWPDFHLKTFRGTRQVYEQLLQSISLETPDCNYTNDQLVFMRGIYDTYLNILQKHRTNTMLASVPYLLMYTSDCSRAFIARSIHSLNSGPVLAGARRYFPAVGDAEF